MLELGVDLQLSDVGCDCCHQHFHQLTKCLHPVMLIFILLSDVINSGCTVKNKHMRMSECNAEAIFEKEAGVCVGVRGRVPVCRAYFF